MKPIPGGGHVQSSLQTRRQDSDVWHSQQALLPIKNNHRFSNSYYLFKLQLIIFGMITNKINKFLVLIINTF